MRQKLFFVYNANSGIRNSLIDSMHKVLNPRTYQCSLCDITFGVFKENAIWKKFRNEAQWETEFLHKDEFQSQLQSKMEHTPTFPVVLIEAGEKLEVLISTEKLNTLKNAEDLISLLEDRFLSQINH